jgi:hypothetical protein
VYLTEKLLTSTLIFVCPLSLGPLHALGDSTHDTSAMFLTALSFWTGGFTPTSDVWEDPYVVHLKGGVANCVTQIQYKDG